MDSCSLFLFLLTFIGGYDLYKISTEYYPLELERAAEARRAVVASVIKYYIMNNLAVSLIQSKGTSVYTVGTNP